MGITLVLGSVTLPVEPGQSVAGDLRVVNDGTSDVPVDLAVRGDGRPFSWLAPEAITVPAGGEATARIGFRLPRASVPPAGPLAFEVVATPRGSGGGPVPATAATVAGTVEVLPFAVLSLALAADDTAGEEGALEHTLTLGNRGNAAVDTELAATTEDAELEVSVAPAAITVPAAGSSATAVVRVAAKAGTRVREARTSTFTVTATPRAGEAVGVSGQFRFVETFSGRKLVVAAVVAAAALIVGAVVFIAHGSSSSKATTTTVNALATGSEAPLAACPAKGHTDQYGVRTIQPSDIANLPKTYTFLRVAADGCTPIRFNPCQPIHYIQNTAAAPPFAADNVREAFKRIGDATGMTFIDDGLTDETSRTGPYVPDRYGQRWAPILIFWDHFPANQTTGAQQVLGNTNAMRVGDQVVSGVLRFNVDAYNNEITKQPIQAGFGPSADSGTGPIGRDNIEWGRILIHELAHVVGLGHTSDFSSIMYPDAAQQTARPAQFNRTDLEGLRYLGVQAGCLPEPPLPTA